MRNIFKLSLAIFVALSLLGCLNKKENTVVQKEYPNIPPLMPISDFFSDGKYWKGEINLAKANKTIKENNSETIYNTIGQLIKIINPPVTETFATTYELFYDDKNNLTQINGLNLKGELSPFCIDMYCTIKLKYDDKNRLIEECAYDTNGVASANGKGCESKVVYTYEDRADYISNKKIYNLHDDLIVSIDYNSSGKIIKQEPEDYQ